MAHQVVCIPGDGIGPEIVEAMRRVVDATGVAIAWQVHEAGAAVMGEYGTPLPQHVLDAVAEVGVAIKGPITTPVGTGFRSVNVALRKHFDLYACVRPCLSQPGDGSRYQDIDLVIIRENTEDLYAGIEFAPQAPELEEIAKLVEGSGQASFRAGSALSLKPISVEGSRRIVRYAFEYARKCHRSKVTAVHKANIMKETDGLFLHVAEEVSSEYPDIAFDHRIVDATCMGLVQDPYQFDVLVLPNLYGDIVSDLSAGLVGGLGMAPGANIGEGAAIFEATHGSAPDIAGKDIANPTAEILSAAMMLDHLGEGQAAERIRAAVRQTLAIGTHVTGDVKRALTGTSDGAVGTQAFADAVIKQLEQV
ncbi:isocitrate/isopropylmalate dehydrogenase family protein [Collinsella sp. zg1085]|uniref:isocitrate/isopropylmalate dehydrogenase family protein n=1 Tax=Collinsella sp. zg1085 TaxID=2844380 RepID=UPI001C0DCF65|nr:isocitrate/isopropylmalate family dehydrogenase [Collinsella sp. zg1085]QWT17363.1 isocitrate/isopropylmalate dehydrogenase family protein [Collinsella sp. zg1085]